MSSSITILLCVLLMSGCLKSQPYMPDTDDPETGEIIPATDLKLFCEKVPSESVESHTLGALKSFLKVDSCETLTAQQDIERIDLSMQKITSLKPLRFFTQLKHLSLAGNPELNPTELSELPESLESLDLQACGLKNLDQMPALIKLKLLIVSANPLGHEIRLKNLPALEEIEAMDLLDVGKIMLPSTAKLRILRLNRSHFSQISDMLAETPGLTELYIKGTAISDLSFVKGLTKLKKLDFSDNDATDLSSLQELRELSHIWGSSNHVVSLTPLAGLTKLEVLHLAGNAINDPSPIQSLPLLWDLNI